MPDRKQVLLRCPQYDAGVDDRMLCTHSTPTLSAIRCPIASKCFSAGRDTMPASMTGCCAHTVPLSCPRYDARVDDRMLCTHITPTLSAIRSPRRLCPIVNETMLCTHSTFYAVRE